MLVSAYRRPATVGEALELLSRPGVVALGGGTKVNAAMEAAPAEVVDLQALGLGRIDLAQDSAVIGATATLQQIADSPALPDVVREAARREQPSTLRAQATIGGCVAAGVAESEFLAALLAHDAVVSLAGPGEARQVELAHVLASLPVPAGSIITAVTISTTGVTAAARTARTPADRPIVAAVARLTAGWEWRLALAGVAATPVLAHVTDDIDPPGDFRGSSEYRRALAAVLSARALAAASASRSGDGRAAGPPLAASERSPGQPDPRPPAADASEPGHIRITLNGARRQIACEPGDKLLTVLRREGCYSVRYGSETGETGAAAVLLDGRLASADVMLAAQADGHEVTTVESLNVATGQLHPIQEALVGAGALQSGYSAGAVVLAAKALLDLFPEPSEAQIRDALSGILDRETGYVKVVEAVRRAAAALRGEKLAPMEPLIVERLREQVFPPPTDDAEAPAERQPGGGTPGPGAPGAEAPVPGAPGGGAAVPGAPGAEAPGAGAAAPGGPTAAPGERAGGYRSHEAPPAVPRLVPSPDVPGTAVVGRPEHKVDAVRLVKGNPSFTDDIELRGMLHAKVLWSPHAHARIVAVDDSAALALPGVHAVLHHRNTRRVKYASGGQTWPNPHPWDQVSFDDKVRHVGDRVAVVAAETPEIAAEACRAIRVTYEQLPAVFGEREAMAEGAPVIHDEADSVGIHDFARNISSHLEGSTTPDVDAALAHADRLFEQTFRVQQVQACPIEPHIAIGWLDEDERLVLRTSTQVPFHVRRVVAPLLGLPVKRIRVIKPRIGGGFGAKQEVLIEDIVGHLVLATRRPVRLELTREEEFVSSRTRHAQTITFRTGVTRDGRLAAQDMRVLANTGPYGTHGFTVQSVTGLRGLSSYNCPAKRYFCDVAYTNRPVAGAFRGYGAPQALFALESHMDDIARALQLDPIEFRRRNWVGAGDPLDIAPRLTERGAVEEIAPEDLPTITSCGTQECVAQGLRAIGWRRRADPSWRRPRDLPHIRRGIGFALCMHGSGIPFIDMGSCSIKMNDDGSFNVLVGATDLGTGADTVLAQIAAEVLGVRVDDIVVYAADTDLTPFDVGAYASSTTYVSGMAVKKAATQVRDKIAARASRLLGLAGPAGVELRERRAWAPDGRYVHLADVALNALHTEDQEQIMGVASHVGTDSPAPFAAQFAEVAVDVETGQVTVAKLVMAVDCGVALNPVTASGQVEGGMVQALGYALTEELVLDRAGRALNARLGPYWIFRADDTPATEVILVQTMEPSGPFGAKAVGEIPMDGVAPAVRNAVLNATGVAINEIPLTPERVWRALRARRHHHG